MIIETKYFNIQAMNPYYKIIKCWEFFIYSKTTNCQLYHKYEKVWRSLKIPVC